MKNTGPSFKDVSDLVRDFGGIRKSRSISSDTRIEADLGITGDDGEELLLYAEKHFGVELHDTDTGIRATFDLRPNEYLFNSEGYDFGIGTVMRWIRREPKLVVVDLTVGDLHRAISKKWTERHAI
jgi:hypothetical protein